MNDAERKATDELWSSLRTYTQARIGLGRVGHSVPIREVLAFQYAHAIARDAVLRPVAFDELTAEFDKAGVPWVNVHSQARDRNEYLKRPDLGRRLDRASLERLHKQRSTTEYDTALVVADGLSSSAVNKHAWQVIKHILEYAQRAGWRMAPIVVARQARVALSDEVGEALGARLVAILIGERPGLSSADSLGIYVTYGPKVGNLDSARNCISNIHDAGLSEELAAYKLDFLFREALRLRLSGVRLKDTTGAATLEAP